MASYVRREPGPNRRSQGNQTSQPTRATIGSNGGYRFFGFSLLFAALFAGYLAGILAGWSPKANGMVALVTAAALAAAAGVYSRPLLSSATWVLGYLFLEMCIRSWALLFDWDPTAPIYRLIPTGQALDQAITLVMWQTLVSLACFVIAYFFANRLRGGGGIPAVRGLSGRRFRAPLLYAVLGVSIALLPLQIPRHQQLSLTSGGDFALAIPGLMTAGIACILAGRWAYGARVPRLLFLSVIAFELLSAVLATDKTGLLAIVVAFALGFVARRSRLHAASGRSVLLQTAILGLIALGVVAVFSLSRVTDPLVSAGRASLVQSGVQSLISRSYDADALIAINRYFDEGGTNLDGATFQSIPVAWIPRQIWPDKPKSFSEVFGDTFLAYSPQSGDRFFSPSYTGEWYLNFSWVGIVIGWLLFGATLGVIDRKVSLDAQFVVIAIAVHFVEGPIDSQIYLALPVIFGAMIALRSPTPPPRAFAMRHAA